MKTKQLLPFCLMAVIGVNGQNAEKKHSLGVNLGGGLHTLLYSPTGGDKSAGAGGLLQLQYQYMFNSKWGIGGGAGLSTLHASSQYPWRTSEFREAQDALDIDITLQGFYHYPFTDKWTAQVGLGASINFPVSLDYKIKSGLDNVSKRDGKITHKDVNVGVQLDLGVLYPMNENIDWYFGLYGNYQFLSTTKEYKNTPIIDAATNGYMNVLNSSEICNKCMVHPLEVGVKVGLRFALRERKAKVVKEEITPEVIFAPEPEPEPIPEPEPVVEPEPEPIPAPVIEEEIVLIMKSANFDFSSIEPKFEGEDVEKAFDNLKKYLEKNPDKNIYLTGHTDNVGSNSVNMKISKKRADAYKSALVEKGFSADRIVTEGKGKTQPIADNSTKAGRAKNRRVEMEVK